MRTSGFYPRMASLGYAITPQVGDYVQPNHWATGELLLPGDGFKDSSFPGAQFRLPSARRRGPTLAVNIKATGRKSHFTGTGWKVRVRIEFVGDGEPSTFSGGWLHRSNQTQGG